MPPLISLPTLIKNGHVFEGRPTGIFSVFRLKSESSIVSALSGILFSLHGYSVNSSSGENACGVLAPGQPPNKSAININGFHCAAGHSHEVLLRMTAEQQGNVCEGELQECKGCSMAKGIRKGIKQSTHTRADETLGEGFAYFAWTQGGSLSGEETVHSRSGRRLFTLYLGCIICATSRTPQNCSSSSSRIVVQTVSAPRW